MKVSEWYQLLESQTYSKEDVCAACMYRMLNIILTTVGSSPENVKSIKITSENVCEVLEQINPHASLIWKLLGLKDDSDYYRYYALDMLTDGRYLKPLIGHIYFMILHGTTLFQYDLKLDDFVSAGKSPALEMQYRQFEIDNNIYLTSIKYQHPIKGDLELEEVLACLCDIFYILTPSSPTYLTDLLLYGTPFIKRSLSYTLKVKSSITFKEDNSVQDLHEVIGLNVTSYNAYGIPLLEGSSDNTFTYKQHTLTKDNLIQALEVR